MEVRLKLSPEQLGLEEPSTSAQTMQRLEKTGPQVEAKDGLGTG